MVVLSANAHIIFSDGYVSYFREIAEGGPVVGSVGSVGSVRSVRLAGRLFCFLHVGHVVVPEVRVRLRLGKETGYKMSTESDQKKFFC